MAQPTSQSPNIGETSEYMRLEKKILGAFYADAELQAMTVEARQLAMELYFPEIASKSIREKIQELRKVLNADVDVAIEIKDNQVIEDKKDKKRAREDDNGDDDSNDQNEDATVVSSLLFF